MLAENLPLWIRLLIIGAFGVLAAPFLIGPLLLKAQHRIQRGFRIDAQSAALLPEAARTAIDAERDALVAAGFAWQGYYDFRDYAPGIRAWFGLWLHTSEVGLAAMTAAIYQVIPDSEPRFATAYTELAGSYAGAFSLCVNNASQAGAFEQDDKLVLRYPGQGVGELARIYHQVARSHPRCRDLEPILAGQEVAHIRKQMLRELDGQVREGLYRLDDIEQCYRLTWTGAIVMTMRHLPPFAWLRQAAEMRRAAGWASP